MRPLAILSLAVALCVPQGVASSDREAWKGLAAGALAQAVARDCAVQRLVRSDLGSGGLWDILRLTEGDASAQTYTDILNTVRIPYADLNDTPAGELVSVADPDWWDRGLFPEATDYCSRDLYLLLPAARGTSARLEGRFPAQVDTRDSYDGALLTGSGSLFGSSCRVWQPPVPSLNGDVARMMFYAITVYGHDFRTAWDRGKLFVAEESYPVISPAYAALLLAWHRADPPDARELRRNEVFASVQGNENPFVSDPQLAEYLWGTLKGQAYEAQTPDDPSDPDDPEDNTPLRGRYTLADKRISLSHPSIPEDAQWTVDDQRVTERFLVPAELGEGRHELRYTAPGTVGKLIIEISR